MARSPGLRHRPGSSVAHRAWTAVSSVEGEHVAHLWFVGANPWLDEVSPIEAITAMRAKDVMAAATRND